MEPVVRALLSTLTVLVLLISVLSCEKSSSSDIEPWEWIHETVWPELCFLTNDWEYQTNSYRAGDTLRVGSLVDVDYILSQHIKLLFVSASGDSEEVECGHIPNPFFWGGFAGLFGVSIPTCTAQTKVPWNNQIEIISVIEPITVKADSSAQAWVWRF